MIKQHKPEVQENETVCDSATVTVDKVQYYCDYCSKIFKSIKTLTIYMKKNHIKGLLNFQCHLCETYFREYSNLDYHMKVEHDTCPNCGASLSSLGTYNGHHLECCGRCPHPCDICQVLCLSVSNVRPLV